MLALAALPFVVGAADWIKGSYVRPHEDDVAALCRECRNDVLKRTFRAHDSSVAKAEWRVYFCIALCNGECSGRHIVY